MSGTSARESYRSGKRTRPSDSQASRMAPPVLFRLPSVAMPTQDSAANASNMNSMAMAMPMAATTALPTMGSPSPTSSPIASSPIASIAPAQSAPVQSAPAQSAAATISAEKASGQRLLNMIIIVLLLAALAVITWISMNRPAAAPSIADDQVSNSAALDTLGELKVPDVINSTMADAKTQPDAKVQSSNFDEIKTSNPADLSLLDLSDAKHSGHHDATEQGSNDNSKSLLVGLDTTGINTAQTDTTSTDPLTTPTAQIQLRSPVPLSSNNATSLVDVQKPSAQLGSASLGSSTTPRVETVSTPSQTTKIFPANSDAARNSSPSPASTTNNSNNTDSSSGDSPSLWDGAQRTSPEGLQLSSKPSASNAQTQVSISQPLSSEFAMPSARTSTDTSAQAAERLTNQTQANHPEQGVTVGGGEKEPYSLRTNLHNTRPDLDPTMLARVAASGAAKSAISNATNNATVVPASPPRAPINSYTNVASAAGQNLYQNNNNNNMSPVNSASMTNSYASVQGNVPTGVTNNGTGTYVPATTNMPGPYGQYPPPNQLTSGPNSLPAATASYSVPPRGTQPNFSQQPVNQLSGYTQPANPNYPQPSTQPTTYTQPGYAQPGYAQPTYNQPTYSQPTYNQPTYNQPTYNQPTYNQANAQSGYGQPSNAYGPGSGSAYPNTTYPTPSAGMPSNMSGLNMPAGYQGNASYPTKPFNATGQVPTGMIGPSGHATQPTGDIAPRPVMGQYGVGTSTPYGTP